MIMKNTNALSALHKREELQAAIRRNEATLERLDRENSVTRRQFLESKSNLDGLRRQSEMYTDRNRRIESEEQSLKQAKLKLDEQSAEIDRLRTEIERHQAEIEAMVITPSPNEVSTAQAALKAELDRQASIEALIDENQKVINNAKIDSQAEELRKRRNLLLAEAATGKDTSAELAGIDAEIAAAEKMEAEATAKISQTVSNAKATIEGLGEMLNQARASVEAKRTDANLLMDAYLLAMAEQELGNYSELVDKAQISLNRLAAIDCMIKTTGISPGFGKMPEPTKTLYVYSVSPDEALNILVDDYPAQ